jgi:hypothetical protein
LTIVLGFGRQHLRQATESKPAFVNHGRQHLSQATESKPDFVNHGREEK